MGRASGGSNTPHWIRDNIFDFLRATSMKMAVENGKICRRTFYFLSRRRWKRDCRELVRFALLMSWMALDWTTVSFASMSTDCERKQFWLLFLKHMLHNFLKIVCIVPSLRGVERLSK